ncbi:hypothetical protein [Stratiformator vulcanicus]|uniref:Uncharacterized protein n=1 Tax=Stratiformator vulcanicus TaxID=2527980 RepID=A0A517QVX7_9PLAN|nr:hypothetical protein [Stratiformator vulcanicus]QDT35806.1 hypothetical protein Pan189_01590 [Stratiformator vulcanicus]
MSDFDRLERKLERLERKSTATLWLVAIIASMQALIVVMLFAPDIIGWTTSGIFIAILILAVLIRLFEPQLPGAMRVVGRWVGAGIKRMRRRGSSSPESEST